MSDTKLALVTGGSAGIGLEVARGLAEKGLQVMITARDAARGEAAARDIASTTGAAAPEVLLVDFSSSASIRALADRFLSRKTGLHILVNNAGTWSIKRQETEAGVERVWATNQLGYFLTTELLRPALTAADRARVVVVASELARGLDLADVEFRRRRYTGVAAYAQSKQANRMWTRALARRLEGTGVTANSLHPGGVATGLFGKGGGLLARGAGAVASLFGKSPREGARTAVWLATAPEVEGLTGRFYVDLKERSCRFTNGPEEEKLFELCASMSGRF